MIDENHLFQLTFRPSPRNVMPILVMFTRNWNARNCLLAFFFLAKACFAFNLWNCNGMEALYKSRSAVQFLFYREMYKYKIRFYSFLTSPVLQQIFASLLSIPLHNCRVWLNAILPPPACGERAHDHFVCFLIPLTSPNGIHHFESIFELSQLFR